MLNVKAPFVAALAVVGALCAGSAQAGGVNWSVSVNLPPVATVVSNGHGYHAQPVYYQPAPVYVQPAPVYYQPAPVYYQPRPVVVYRPGVEVVGGRFAARHHWHDQNRRDRHDRHEERRHRREHRDEYGDRRDFGNHR